MNFSDYEQVFNNFSVPVSCCNTTNPLANETTCPDIVMDTNVTTELIYTEVLHHCSVIVYHLILLQGCVPQLVSYFHYIHSVVAGVSIGIGGSQVLASFCVIILLGKFLNDYRDDWYSVYCSAQIFLFLTKLITLVIS